MSGSGDTEDSFSDSTNPFLPVRSCFILAGDSCNCVFQIIGFKNAKASVNDHPENVPYGLTDLTAAIKTTLHPLMVSR